MKLKNIAIYALVTGGLSLPVMTSGIALSHAAEGAVASGHLITFKPEAPRSAWTATQISAEQSKRPYCSVEAKFEKSGTTIVIARNKRGLNSMAIDFGHDLFEKGKSYDIHIGTDIGLERRFPAKALSSSLLMAQVGKDKPFMRAISYDGQFTFFVPQSVRATYTLKGAQDALTRLERCLSTLEDFMPPLADETYLREARATAVKKRASGQNELVAESVPSRTAHAKAKTRSAPEDVPVPPRKASMMNIKVTKVEAPVVYEGNSQVNENDTVAQPDILEIAREEISQKIDELAASTTSDTPAGQAEERMTVTEKKFLAVKPKPEKQIQQASVAETPVEDDADVAEELPAPETTETAVAVKKAESGETIVADVSIPVEDAQEAVIPDVVAVETATPPADETLLTPMPGETQDRVAAVTTAPQNRAAEIAAQEGPVYIEVKKQPDQIVWHADRAEVRDPAARNIMALEKKGETGNESQPVQTASAGGNLLPAPDLSLDMPTNGAYFPEQMAALPAGDISDAITVKVEKATPTQDAQVASLQAVSGPFDAAEYARLKKLAQEKHIAEKHQAGKNAQAEAAHIGMAEPINIMSEDHAAIAEIATAAGEDLEAAGMIPEPATATAKPMSLTFANAGTLSREDYLALKDRQADTSSTVASLVKQASLSEAVNQLVPTNFQITVGNGVDMTQLVSWHEGENWQDIIAKTLGSVGVEAKINGNVVMLMTMAQ